MICIAGLSSPPVSAGMGEGQSADTCDRAARKASDALSVPLDVLRAITRIETGLTPWPWTVNMEGEGHWFESRDKALVFVFKHFKRGARSFDLGCFQLNFKWHGPKFRSIEDMLDPYANATYAAKLLAELHAELGDWSAAAGAYHSRTPSVARLYTSRFTEIRDSLKNDPSQVRGNTPAALIADRQPMFGGGMSRMGSLVALDRPSARPLVQIMTE